MTDSVALYRPSLQPSFLTCCGVPGPLPALATPVLSSHKSRPCKQEPERGLVEDVGGCQAGAQWDLGGTAPASAQWDLRPPR